MRGCTAVWWLDIVEASSTLETIDLELGLLGQPECSIREQERLTTRRALRVLLRQYARTDVACSPMAVTENGRPELTSPDAPTFSISHTAGVALIGLCESAPLGIDLEKQRPLKMSLEHRAEIAIGAQDAGLQVPSGICEAKFATAESDRDFLVVWTQLEALAKAHDKGIGAVVQEVRTRGRCEPETDAGKRSLIPEDCRITTLNLDHDFVAAVVHPRTHNLDQVREFPTSAAEIRNLCDSALGLDQG